MLLTGILPADGETIEPAAEAEETEETKEQAAEPASEETEEDTAEAEILTEEPEAEAVRGPVTLTANGND